MRREVGFILWVQMICYCQDSARWPNKWTLIGLFIMEFLNPIFLSDNIPDYSLLVGKFSRYRLAKYPINHQAIIYPSAVFVKYQYQSVYKIFADYALNMQVWGDPAFARKFIPVAVVKYNMTGFSSSGKDKTFESHKPMLIKKYLGTFIYFRWRLKFYKKKFNGETF